MSRSLKWIRQFIGSKTFYKELFLVSMPIAMQQFVSAIVNSLDTIMVATWGGSEATTAIALANRYFNTFNQIMMALAVTCSIFVAQYYGAKKFERLKEIFGIGIIFTLLLGIIATLFGFYFRKEIISFFIGTEANTSSYQYGVQYLSIVVFSFIPLAFTNAMTFTYRPMKLTRIPLYGAITASLSNAIFNWILIYGMFGFPSLGVQGAAIATIISRLLEMIVLFAYYLKKKPLFYGTWKQIFGFPVSLIRDVFKRSRPLVFAQILTESMGIFMLFVYARIEIGNAANVAAFTVSTQIVELVMVLIGGMGTGAAVMVGSRLGANQIDEARQHAKWQLSYVIMFAILAGIIMILLIPVAQVAYNFRPEEYQLLSSIMILHAITLPFMVFSLNVIFITRSGGYTKAPFYISNLVYYLVKLPIIVIFVYLVPNLFAQSPWLHQFLIAFGLTPSMMVFVFFLDRLIELIRTGVAALIYKNAGWSKNITQEA